MLCNVCMYLSIYVSMYLCIYVSMYLCIYVCYVCMHACMHACMYDIYIYIESDAMGQLFDFREAQKKKN